VAISSSESLADSSRADIVERHVQCAQSSMHLAESAALSVRQQSVAVVTGQ